MLINNLISKESCERTLSIYLPPVLIFGEGEDEQRGGWLRGKENENNVLNVLNSDRGGKQLTEAIAREIHPGVHAAQVFI